MQNGETFDYFVYFKFEKKICTAQHRKLQYL